MYDWRKISLLVLLMSLIGLSGSPNLRITGTDGYVYIEQSLEDADVAIEKVDLDCGVYLGHVEDEFDHDALWWSHVIPAESLSLSAPGHSPDVARPPPAC